MILGESAGIRQALVLAERFARARVPVLLLGARGTGKELFARYIHEQSGRLGEFVDVNCGAVPPSLAEALLFGHERGAFTGAHTARVGWLEESDGGTLFLDEFGDLPAESQVKVLRALETGEVRPVGGRGVRRLDLRIVAAVQTGDRRQGAAHALRPDLLDRVAVGVIELPPLRERSTDPILLASHFAGLDGRVLEAGVAEVLMKYSWPGNVRELRAVVARAGCLVENGTIPPRVISEAIMAGASLEGHSIGSRTWVLDICRSHDWNAGASAAALGVHRATLHRWLTNLGVSLRGMKMSQDVVRRRSTSRDNLARF